MKKDRKSIHIKQIRSIQNTCSACGLKSTKVEKSIKFNKYFCIDCLLDYIRNNL
jgi:hypothetical protein